MPLRTVRTFIAGQQPLTVPRTMTVADVAQQMKAQGKGACIVVEGSRLIGWSITLLKTRPGRNC